MFDRFLLASLLLIFSQLATAAENFITHETTPYPPACVSTADLEDVFTPSSSRIVYGSSIVQLTGWPDTNVKANVEMEVYRRGCSDTDRSVMFI